MTEEFDFTPDALEAAGALTPSPDPGYTYPTAARARENLERWMDAKLGVIIHWGIYNLIGQAGSWSLHRDDLGDFTDKPADFTGSDADYHRWYYEQRHRFDASDFDSGEWARLCAEAGMKYVVFTTKHHDGFALYDTAYSNLKVTAEDIGVGRDIFGEVATSFREAGMSVGAYFSKPDWSRPEYWDLARPIHDRFANYDTHAEPRRWARFVEHSHDQIAELLTNYGRIDILWLDGGWVRAPREDIDIDGIAQLAQRLQPGILVVDREVHGPAENYRTPEQEIPDDYLPYPWEACVTWTKSWTSMQVDEPARPTWQIVANLLRIVARGGNYLVGFGPDATGAMSRHLKAGLAELAGWMQGHGEGIYATRALAEQPAVAQVSGVGHEWFVVSKHGEHYLYGVPPQGQTSPVEIVIDLDAAAATALGGARAEVVSSGDRLTVRLDNPADGPDLAYVVRLSR